MYGVRRSVGPIMLGMGSECTTWKPSMFYNFIGAAIWSGRFIAGIGTRSAQIVETVLGTT